MKARILVIEDDRALARVLRDNLAVEGFLVDAVHTLRAAADRMRDTPADLVVLDLTLPDGDGIAFCGSLRQRGGPPMIVLTARSQKADKLKGLAAGADDYVTKPFDLEEFIARIHALLRRTRRKQETLALGPVLINFQTMTATSGGRNIHLTAREFEILRYLSDHQDRVVSRDELLEVVWAYGDMPITRSVDHAISRLRKKLEAEGRHSAFIHAVHGTGYRLTPPVSPPEGAQPLESDRSKKSSLR